MTATTYWNLGAQSSDVRCLDGELFLFERTVPLGIDTLAGRSLRHTPPTPLGIEHAIELTEDVVMPLARHLEVGGALMLSGAGATLILQALGAAAGTEVRLTLEEVEYLFNRIAAVSQGRPSGQDALPTAPEFYAAMVILRECLHHLRFSEVVLQAA
ncbi:MAG: hypothetical protein U5M53_01740 [Rhodoferax sp.]|nr:hypothetical protein [Rhodoferax sp.]